LPGVYEYNNQDISYMNIGTSKREIEIATGGFVRHFAVSTAF